MRRDLGAVALAVLGLLPAAASAQEFPPPEQAMRTFEGAPPRSVRFPIGVTFGYGVPMGSFEKGTKLGDVFASLRSVRFEAGLGGKFVGVAGYYRHGTPELGDRWCAPGASCTATFKSVGAALEIGPSAAEQRVGPMLAIGFGKAVGEVENDRTRAFQRMVAWEMFSSMSVMWRLGDVTSPFRLGGAIAGHMMIPGHYETPAGKVEIAPQNLGTPVWFEFGLKLSFD